MVFRDGRPQAGATILIPPFPAKWRALHQAAGNSNLVTVLYLFGTVPAQHPGRMLDFGGGPFPLRSTLPCSPRVLLTVRDLYPISPS